MDAVSWEAETLFSEMVKRDTNGFLLWLPRTCWRCLRKGADTVGQPPNTEIGVPNMPSLKAKKLRKLPQEKVLLEL
jgi:hypothetical protein